MTLLTQNSGRTIVMIIFITALVTNNWLVFDIDSEVKKDGPTTRMNKFGIFQECVQTGDVYGCKGYPSQNKYPDVHKWLMVCQLVSVLGLVLLMFSVLCSYNRFCAKYHLDTLLQVLGAVLLLVCVVIFSNYVEPALRKATDGNITKGYLTSVKSKYSYSFYLALIAALLALSAGVSEALPLQFKRS